VNLTYLLSKCSCCYAVSQHLILDLLHVLHYVNVQMYQYVYHIMCYVTRVTRRSRGRELGQEVMCNRVRDRYEDEVAHTNAEHDRIVSTSYLFAH
jgi:hypothetical protein